MKIRRYKIWNKLYLWKAIQLDLLMRVFFLKFKFNYYDVFFTLKNLFIFLYMIRTNKSRVIG